MTQYNQKQLYTSYEVMDSYGQLTSINQMTKSNRFGIGKNHQTDDHNSSLGQVLTPPRDLSTLLARLGEFFGHCRRVQSKTW